MKNQKGFTLYELIGCIIVAGSIGLFCWLLYLVSAVALKYIGS